MTNTLSLSDFAAACRDEDDVRGLWQLTVAFYRARGIDKISYHSDTGRGPDHKDKGVAAVGFPKGWVCHYIEADLVKIDPIPELALTMTRPFRWSETAGLMRLSEAQEGYMRQLAQANLGDGLAMQVFGPNLRNAYVGLGFADRDRQFEPAEMFELQCAAQIAHIRYCELTEEEERSPADLSPREREILEWIARGKSNSVIADILGLSRHTVDTITRRIYDKLNVNDRTTAAIKGLGSGLLRYDLRRAV